MTPLQGKRLGLYAAVFAAFTLLHSIPVFAQAQTGEIRLSVKDSSGAGMQASGKAENRASGVSRGFRTDSGGSYTLTGLPYWTYRLAVEATGFTTQTALVEVNSATAVEKTISLAVGAANYTMDVVGVTPLGGTEIPVEQIPLPVQTLTPKDFESTGALDLSDLMNRRLGSVNINETQGNPVQPDVNYRGYTASPLLGTPEGLSIYMDGVRLNQPFGDVVSWDLIPRIAISEMALIPGSNPLFGLNTLGGALSLQTKSGASKPGTSIGVSGGSFGRRGVEVEHGWSNTKGFNWYGAGNLFHDGGWRQASPSDVRQAFSKLGWQGSKTSISLSGAYADNQLIGNGLGEFRGLQRDYTSPYTLYDQTNNRAPSLNLSLRHTPNTNLTLSGNVYFRYIRADSYNGDINEGSLDQSVYQPSAADQAALRAAGYSGFPTSGANASNTPFPYWRCIAQALQGDEPGEKCNGLLNRTYTKQHNYGLSGQATWLTQRGGLRNQLTAGAAHDRSNVDFVQTAELGYILPDLNVKGLGIFADGVHAGNVDGEPFDNRVDLRGGIHTSSLFGTDTLQTGKSLTMTFSGRFNSTVVDNYDRITPKAGTGSLTGHHVFRRLNPSVGFTYSPNTAVGIYGSYAEGSRAPTSIELGCADPAAPCKLPNSLAGDPPLKQVVTRTLEAGVRSGPERRVQWNAGWFFGQNHNDILFVSSAATEPARDSASADVGSLTGVRVLIVDDNLTNRRILELLVRGWNMKSTTAASGEQALLRLREARNNGEAFELILTDMHMPNMDGFDFVGQIKQETGLSAATVMMLTSGAGRGDTARCEDLGISAYLLKPVRKAELHEAIMRALFGAKVFGAKAAPIITRNLLEIERPPAKVMSVLVAEDNSINMTLACRLLEKRGHQIHVAVNGQQALDAMRERTFDLVLMDVQMPEMDGLTATRAIREIEKTTHHHQPIVAMTALALAGDRERCLASGMDDYLSKPIRPDELDAILNQYAGTFDPSAPEVKAASAPATLDSVNAEELLARTDNDLELIQELVEMFHESAPRLLQTARDAAAQENAPALEQAAHSLKGSLANLSAGEGSSIAGELEDLARSGKGHWGPCLDRLDHELTRVTAALDRICTGGLQ